MLMSGVMTTSMLPAYLTQISIPAAADDPYPWGTDDTDPTIDFDYESKYGVHSPEDAMKLLAKENASSSKIEESNWKSNYSKYPWRHASNNEGYDEGSLRKVLESTNAKDTYVALAEGDTDTWNDMWMEWEPVRITTDKVLDLNGKSLIINYNANRDNRHKDNTTFEGDWYNPATWDEYEESYDWRGRQNHENMKAHMAHLFEIDKGATLTIIDSSKWRGDGNGEGTGEIRFDGYMVNHIDYDGHKAWALEEYTNRDIFYVANGNLVVYGGHFQAGSSQTQGGNKTSFHWGNFKKAIGKAVELGVSIAEYSTGLNTATAAYQDVLDQVADKTVLNGSGYTSGSSVTPKDGSGGVEETQKKTPKENETRNQTVSEKAEKKNADIAKGEIQGTKEGENKANDEKTAKYDKNTKIAEAQNNIAKQATSQKGIMGMVDSAFGLFESIGNLVSSKSTERATTTIKGTVVRVESNGCFVSYGGHYEAYGCTPNVRKACVEVNVQAGASVKTWDHSKHQGGVCYIYDGLFEANSGANVFNFYRRTSETQRSTEYSAKNESTTREMHQTETNGIQVIEFENWEALANGTETEGQPLNTANVQVRGGVFRCNYDLINMANVNEKWDGGLHYRAFPGTSGSVNLGVNSYGADLIRDGRIQLCDPYGDGCLVLLDDQEEGYNGLYHYRLLCGDTELRSKSYLEVYPNQAKTNASFSMQLAYYLGTGTQTKEIFSDDEEGNNIRAPYRQQENYFDFKINAENVDNEKMESAYAVKPNFHYTKTDNMAAKMDVYGKEIKNSEVWYYPEPRTADGSVVTQSGTALGDAPYANARIGFLGNATLKDTDQWRHVEYWSDKIGYMYGAYDRDIKRDHYWNDIIEDCTPIIVEYDEYQHIRRNMKYFTYKVYQVDPLTRENLPANGKYGEDDPLLTVRYGAAPEETALKCKLPLKEVEARIKRTHPEWQGYRAGEMYRIELEIEEHVGIGNNAKPGYGCGDDFGQTLEPAKTSTSILFRCFHSSEQKEGTAETKEHAFTPVQWSDYEPGTQTIFAGDYETIEVRNGKTGMTDWEADTVIFDTYYQWWECDENGNDIRLIAGTDHIYDDGLDKHKYYENKKEYNDNHPGKADHCPSGWNFSYTDENGKSFTYCNTVDPNDPDKDKLDTNGLPKRTSDGNWKWRADQIHMYTAETLVQSDIKRPEGMDSRLSPKNNDVFATNHDSCYIPEELDGSYIKVKVITVNTRWPLAYDKKQTFESHPMKVITTEAKKPQILSNYPNRGKNENGGIIRYATYDKPVVFSLSTRGGIATEPGSIGAFNSLIDGEYIHTITYKLSNGKTKRFTDLHLTWENREEVPKVTYPDDFIDKQTILENLPTSGLTIQVQYETYKDGKPFRSSDWSKETKIIYAIEATGVNRIGYGLETIHLSNSRDLRELKPIQAFQPIPATATRGYDFTDYTNTNDRIAALDANGYITLTGEIGETTITVKDTEGREIPKTIQVVRDIDEFEFRITNPPVIGEKLDYTLPTVPAGAPYHVERMKWWKSAGGEKYTEVSETDVAEYYTTYLIAFTVKPDEYYDVPDKQIVPFKATVVQSDGSIDTYTGTGSGNRSEKGHLYTGTYTILYTYKAQIDHEPKPIDRIYMDFPTEVMEGDSFLKWLEDVEIYTNGYNEGFTFDITPLYGADAAMIAGAYGYSTSSSSTKQLNYFLKGVQTGVAAEIKIPKELKELGDVFADEVTLYVNGEESKEKIRIGSDDIYVLAPNSLTVTPSDRALPVKPEFSMKDTHAVVGQTINVKDLLVCDDPGVSVIMTGVNFFKSEDQWSEYFSCDLDAGTLTPLKAESFKKDESTSDYLILYYTVILDTDGDGYPEYKNGSCYAFDTIYATADDVPPPTTVEPKKPVKVKITVLAPDGKTASEGEYSYDFVKSVIQIPENTYITGIFDTDGKITSEQFFEEGKSYTVKTVSVDEIEIHSGGDSVHAFFKDADGRNVENLQISADNSHFTLADSIKDLNPDTTYTLYYKQGIDGKIYTKKFRTAKEEYGVYIGRQPVTDANLGNLEQDGWHYDPDTKTLTLKNFTLRDYGAEVYTVDFLGTPVPITAAVASKDALTLNLIGNNRIEYSSEGLFAYVVFAEKDLTIIGNGNLTISGGTQYFLNSHNGNIRLNGTGTLTLEGGFYEYGSIAFYPENGEILYTNGTIINQPRIATTWDEKKDQRGVLIGTENVGKLNFTGKVHDIKIEAAGLDGKYETVAESDFADLIQQNYDNSYHDRYDEEKSAIRITPVHNDANRTATAENHVSGSCDSGATYHLSCDCGHISEETFAVPAEEHLLVKHAAKAATCMEAGTVEYWECEHCGERYADADGTKPLTAEAQIAPALGHKLTHHAGVEATCSKAGSIEYWTCDNCGERYADKNCTVPIGTSNVTIAATGHEWVQHFAKPATCEKDGEKEHWECLHCGQLSADKDGTKLLKKEDIIEKAFGHTWGEWTTSKEATTTAEGEEIRVCNHCDETEKRVIPAKQPAVTTTAKPVTTTTKIVTTTIKPVTTTAKVVTTTAKPVTTLTKAITTTAKPVTTTVKAITTTAKPVTTTAKVVATTAKPVTTTAKVVATTAKPATTTTKVGVTTVKPVTTTAKVATTTAKATTTTAKATTTTTKVTTTTAKVTTTSAAATTTTTKAATTTAKVTTTSAKTTITTAKATTTTAKATTTTAKVTTTAAKATTTTAKVTTTTAKETTTTAELTTTTEAITTTSETTAQRTTTVITSDGGTDTTPAQTTTTAPPEPEPLKGDVDGNDEVSVEDAQLALKSYTKRIAGVDMGLTEEQIKAADVNEDGELSVDDAQNILIYYVNNTVAGNVLTWEQLLGKQQQAQPRPMLLTLHEDIWIEADRYLTEAETL